MLMKSKERTRDGSLRMLKQSLELLQTEHVDVRQLHNIGSMSDVEQVLREGRRNAFEQAREQGVDSTAQHLFQRRPNRSRNRRYGSATSSGKAACIFAGA